MQVIKQNRLLIGMICFVFILQAFTLFNHSIFWYLYTFTLLICMAVATIKINFFDQVPTWQYLIYGIGYGTLTYGLIRIGYEILHFITPSIDVTIDKFLQQYGPSNIWHYTILVFIIIVGEEMFWRGFVQQQLKKQFPILQSIIISSVLFSISLLIIGFVPGALAALLAGFIFGSLYEWKKSLPLIIITHVVFILLLFLVIPLPI